jgi:hypothetical protein
VILFVFELLDEATVVVACVKLLANFTPFLATTMCILVVDIHPFLALTTSPCLTVAFVSGLTLVGYERHIARFAIAPLFRGHVLFELLVGVKPHCATTAFDVDTSVIVEVLLADALHALTAPLVVVSAVLCKHLDVVNKVVV